MSNNKKYWLRTACLSALCCGLVFHASDSDARSKNKVRKIPSWYLSLSGSVNFVQDVTYLSQTGPSANQSGTINLDEGYGISGAIGYRPRYTNSFWDHTRLEFELGLLDNEIESQTVPTGINTVVGDIQVAKMMANGYVDFSATPQWRPYLGGGLGVARVHVENDEDTVLAYQGMAGLAYTPKTFPAAEFLAGYRYFATSNPSFTTPGTGTLTEIEYDAHHLEAGMRLYF